MAKKKKWLELYHEVDAIRDKFNELWEQAERDSIINKKESECFSNASHAIYRVIDEMRN